MSRSVASGRATFRRGHPTSTARANYGPRLNTLFLRGARLTKSPDRRTFVVPGSWRRGTIRWLPSHLLFFPRSCRDQRGGTGAEQEHRGRFGNGGEHLRPCKRIQRYSAGIKCERAIEAGCQPQENSQRNGGLDRRPTERERWYEDAG